MAFAPKAILTSAIWHWGIYYIDIVKRSWPAPGRPPSTGAAGKAAWSISRLTAPSIPSEREADGRTPRETKFKKGDSSIFTIFTGPLKDNTGANKVPAGTAMTANELLNMNWLVAGVEGTIPK